MRVSRFQRALALLAHRPIALRVVAVSVSALIVAPLVGGCSGASKDQSVATPSEQPTQSSVVSEEPTPPIVRSPEAEDAASSPKGAWAEFITYYLADGFDVLVDDSLGEYEGDTPSMAQFGGYLAQFGKQAKRKLAEKLAADGPTSAEISDTIEALIAVSEQAKDVGVQVQGACTRIDSRPSTECQIAWEKVGATLDALTEEFDPWWLSDGARFVSSAESAGEEAGWAVTDGALTPDQAGEAWVPWARESAPAGMDFMNGYLSTGAEPWWELCQGPGKVFIPTAVPTAGEEPGQCPGAVWQP